MQDNESSDNKKFTMKKNIEEDGSGNDVLVRQKREILK